MLFLNPIDPRSSTIGDAKIVTPGDTTTDVVTVDRGSAAALPSIIYEYFFIIYLSFLLIYTVYPCSISLFRNYILLYLYIISSLVSIFPVILGLIADYDLICALFVLCRDVLLTLVLAPSLIILS